MSSDRYSTELINPWPDRHGRSLLLLDNELEPDPVLMEIFFADGDGELSFTVFVETADLPLAVLEGFISEAKSRLPFFKRSCLQTT